MQRTEYFAAFRTGTPVLVPGFQWSGWSNSGIQGQIWVCDDQIRASHGLSTVVLHSGWKSPPHPPNTSEGLGYLKYRSGSIGSWFLSEISPIDPVRPIQIETRSDRSKQSYRVQIDGNILSAAAFGSNTGEGRSSVVQVDGKGHFRRGAWLRAWLCARRGRWRARIRAPVSGLRAARRRQRLELSVGARTRNAGAGVFLGRGRDTEHCRIV